MEPKAERLVSAPREPKAPVPNRLRSPTSKPARLVLIATGVPRPWHEWSIESCIPPVQEVKTTISAIGNPKLSGLGHLPSEDPPPAYRPGSPDQQAGSDPHPFA